MADQRYLTVKETSEFLRISVSTLSRLIRQNGIPSRKIGHRRLFDRDDLAEWMRAYRDDDRGNTEGIEMDSLAYKRRWYDGHQELPFASERRASKRIQKTLVIETLKEGTPTEASCLNLGGGGMFIRDDRPWELDLSDRFRLKFNIPGDELPIVVDCEVVWSTKYKEVSSRPKGFAVKFLNMRPHDTQRIKRYMA